MRLGNFWGLPVPMFLLVYDGEYQKLMEDLSALNTGTSKHLLTDIQKELLALMNVINSANYELPEYTKVLYELRLQGVTNCTDLQYKQLITEISYEVIAIVLNDASKGKYYQVPELLRDYVQKYCDSIELNAANLTRIPRKIVRTFQPADSLNLGRIVNDFRLKSAPPKYLYFGTKRTELTKDLEKVWKFYADREAIVRQLLDCCVVGYQEAEVFGLPFLGLIKRKPMSVIYKVMELLEYAKSKSSERILPWCIEECRKGISTYEALVNDLVVPDTAEDNTIVTMTKQELIEFFAFESERDADFFMELVRNGKLTIEDFKFEDWERIYSLYKRLKNFQTKSMAEIFDVSCSDDELCEQCTSIGVCGLNQVSMSLFRESIANITLSSQGKVKKSEQELEEIHHVVADVKSLLSTLIPVGTKITDGR